MHDPGSRSSTLPLSPLKVLTLRCREASELLSRAADENLGLTERLALRLHLLICRPCRTFRRQIEHLRRVLRAAGETTTGATGGEGASLSEAARQRLQALVDSRFS